MVIYKFYSARAAVVFDLKLTDDLSECELCTQAAQPVNVVGHDSGAVEDVIVVAVLPAPCV